MRSRVFILIGLSVLMAFTTIADNKKKNALYAETGDKQRTYNVEQPELWKAAIEAAKEHFTLDQIHKEEGVFTFTSGAGFTTHGFNVNVTFKNDPEDGTIIKLNFHKRKTQIYSFGAGGNITDKFFKSVDKILDPDGSKAKQEPTKQKP
jgi:hypothetical protein